MLASYLWWVAMGWYLCYVVVINDDVLCIQWNLDFVFNAEVYQNVCV
jgi:hypothetical protein